MAFLPNVLCPSRAGQKEACVLSEEEKAAILERVAKRAGDYEERSISCSQGTVAALQEEFGLAGGTEMVRAAAFMPGVASRKETCGAVIGGLMALGLAFGRDRVHGDQGGESIEELFLARQRAWRFCEEFKKVYGSTMCGDIRPQIMGRDYNSMDPADRRQFMADRGPAKCRVLPELAARIAATIILEARIDEERTPEA